MENCLVKKLRGALSVPYLRKMDDVVAFFNSGFNSTIVGYNSLIEVFDMNGTPKTSAQGTLALTADYDGFIRIKNTATGIGLGKTILNIKASDFASFNVNDMFSVASSTFSDSLENVIKWLPNITTLNLNNCGSVTGNLDSIIKQEGGHDALVLSRLGGLYIKNTKITCKRSTITRVTTLLGSGNFQYEGAIIIEDE